MCEELGVAGTIGTRKMGIDNLNVWLNHNADAEIIDIKVVDHSSVLIIYRKEG